MYESSPGGKSTSWLKMRRGDERIQNDIFQTEEMHVQRQRIIEVHRVGNSSAAC